MEKINSNSKKQHAFLLIGILMIACTLRAPFTGVAPLLDMMRDSFSLTTAQTGLLTTIPLIAFAVISPFVSSISRYLGNERSLLTAMIIICLGIALRSEGSAVLLYLGTAIIGCGIAMGNVLLPSIVKRDYPDNISNLTGAYTLIMGTAAAIGSAMVVPIALYGFGWSGSLLSLVIFPLLAIFFWIPHLRYSKNLSLSGNPALKSRGIWSSPLAWQVTLYLGVNSFIYYFVIGWLPSILISYGYSEQHAGSLHGICFNCQPQSLD